MLYYIINPFGVPLLLGSFFLSGFCCLAPGLEEFQGVVANLYPIATSQLLSDFHQGSIGVNVRAGPLQASLEVAMRDQPVAHPLADTSKGLSMGVDFLLLCRHNHQRSHYANCKLDLVCKA